MSRTKGNAPVVSATEASGETSQTDKGQVMSDSKEVQVSTQPDFFFGEHEVRVVLRDGEPWFVASDVAQALGYRDAANAARNLADHQRGTHKMSTRSGEQQITVINESGLYRLVLRSRKPEAEKFSDWVTGEVLPSIRKTGIYVGKPFSVNPTDTLTVEEQNTLRVMLRTAAERLPHEKQAAAMITGWSKLKSHFKCSYREIPRAEFSEAVSIIARHTADWGAAPDESTRKTLWLTIEGDKVLSCRPISPSSVDVDFSDDSSVEQAIQHIPYKRIPKVIEMVTEKAMKMIEYQLSQRKQLA